MHISLGVWHRRGEEELDGTGAVIGVHGGDPPPIDGDTDTDIEGDDKLRRDRKHC